MYAFLFGLKDCFFLKGYSGAFMFVYVKFEDSKKIEYFGPATPGECESWMKIKKIFPRYYDDLSLKQSLLKNNRSNMKLLTE